MSEPHVPGDWSRILRNEWEARAKSSHRDYYIASIPDVRDSQRWVHQARIDAELALYGIPPERRGTLNVLEIGCGIGRLAPFVAPLVCTYTGIDVSPSMIDEALARRPALPSARFVVCDGLSLPPAVQDRKYDVIFALAVYIHCPLVVCQALFASGRASLAAGGSMRGQVLADPTSDEGIDPASAANMAIIHAQMAEVESQASAEQLSLIEGQHYTGHRFGFRELREELEKARYAAITLWRFDRYHMYFAAVG